MKKQNRHCPCPSPTQGWWWWWWGVMPGEPSRPSQENLPRLSWDSWPHPSQKNWPRPSRENWPHPSGELAGPLTSLQPCSAQDGEPAHRRANPALLWPPQGSPQLMASGAHAGGEGLMGLCTDRAPVNIWTTQDGLWFFLRGGSQGRGKDMGRL